MAKFRYQGQSAQGQTVSGVQDGVSDEAVASVLLGRGITPISIEAEPASADMVKKINSLLGADKVKPVDLIMFCRQMYTVTKAGIPLTRGLRGIAGSLRHEYFRETLHDIVERLEAGTSLSGSMRHHPKVFNGLFISMINVGETTGRLDEIFQQMGFYIERDEETKKRIKSAMRYPTFVIFALIAAVTTVNIMVIPAFANMFKKFDADLPFVTKLLIGMSDIFTQYWYVLLLLFVGAIVSFIVWLKTPAGAHTWGRRKLRLPIVGELIERASMARYTRSFALMLRAGVPITQALNLCGTSIDNPYLEKKVTGIREGIERGESLIRTHQAAEMFTPLVLQMVAVGEESGQVEELLAEISDFYEREVDYDLKTLTDRIEPILIVSLAVFVLILALGILLPLLSMWEIQQ